MDIEGKFHCGIVKRASRSGFAKTALRASTLTALGLLIALAVLLPNAAAEAQSSPASTATATATATPTDYDTDADGLIEIKNLAQLNAVRYDLDGDSKQDTVSATDWAIYTAAFPNPASGMGCELTDHDDDTTTAKQATCKGYELMADLDFDTDGDGDVDSSDTNSYPNWTPIGTAANKFDAIFKGNSNGSTPKIAKISNLKISGSRTTAVVGLFGATSDDAHIEGVGLVDANVNITAAVFSNARIGALVGDNDGTVIACYSAGESAITVRNGIYAYAGGLVGVNTGTIAASFSRATVYMSSNREPYIGGLAGYNGNEGEITATYAAGAVKGKGDGGGSVSGLVGYNEGTINASYSIAPVTSSTMTDATTATKPSVLGLTYTPTTGGTVTASYWDFTTSGIPDDAGTAMPEGKSTFDLMSPTDASGIYAGWNTLTINGVNNVTPWDFSSASPPFNSTSQHPLLTYGGHTTDISGNQLFLPIRFLSWYDGHIGEGMYLAVIETGTAFSRQTKTEPWQWQSSTDGITWGSTLVPNTLCGVQQDRTCGAMYRATNGIGFIVRSELEGKYIRAGAQFETVGHAYTRVIGKMKLASPFPNPAVTRLFQGGHNPPRVGTEIRYAGAKGDNGEIVLWQRCDTNGANPSGCEYVGNGHSYIPAAGDLNHYLRAHVYARTTKAGIVGIPRTTVEFARKVADIFRGPIW